jgi:flagellar basal body-associated protein FliL
MATEDNQEAGATETEETPKKNKKKIALFAVLGIVGLVGGAGVPMMLMSGAPVEENAEEAHHEEEFHEEVPRIEMAEIGLFTVNLSDAHSFVKARILIEFDANLLDKQTMIHEGTEGGEAHGGGASGGAAEAEAGGGLHPHLAKNMNKFRDVIIGILSAKKDTELLTTEGKLRVKDEIVDGLNEALALEEPPVVGVLFTEFIIQ